MPEAKKEVHCEKHYRVVELAKLWNVSPDTIRRWFRCEPGVLVCSRRQHEGKHSRSYATLLIPESVVRRVHLHLSIPPDSILYQSQAKAVPQTISQQNHMRGNAPSGANSTGQKGLKNGI